jgi:hypothetical protein
MRTTVHGREGHAGTSAILQRQPFHCLGFHGSGRSCRHARNYNCCDMNIDEMKMLEEEIEAMKD